MNIEEILTLGESPARTAALVAWLQSLFQNEGEAPVLVGGAAIELYTTGAYTTGDIDLVGAVPSSVRAAIEAAGFERHGRHWIHDPAQVFVEFRGSALEPDEVAHWIELEGQRIRVISVEDLLVDRLGAWEHWKSSVDGANAFMLWRAQREHIDVERLERRLLHAGWHTAYQSLHQFAARWSVREPSIEKIEAWANAGP